MFGFWIQGQITSKILVAKRVKAPQRFSSRRVYESRWAIFESWCKQSQLEFEKPTLSSIADFFTYLFNEKALKPTTIAGYRTAIADHIGPAGIEISHSFELNRLIASFDRDRPVKDRNIPSWDLSLVLLALTKPPFEPLKEAPLKILTFKTVFIMTLASGRRRGEVHAWTFRSLKHKSGWKEITVSPSSVFLAKNQLALDGPSIIQPVVIPALKPSLDQSLAEDMTLCPVRSLRYYIDKTKDLRKGKHLLFISFKRGFSGDIQRSTISSWINRQLCLRIGDLTLKLRICPRSRLMTYAQWRLPWLSNGESLLTNFHIYKLLFDLFIYLGFYVAFNTVQVISRWVVGRAEETSTYSSLGFCTVNFQPTVSNYQLSHLRR